MNKLRQYCKKYWVHSSIFIVFVAALLLRVIHLNYNVPSSDEAVYIIVGKLGIFKWDWWSYSAQSWMAGQAYIYPSLTAMAYELGGIVGSRFLNVVFSLLALVGIFVFTYKIYGTNKTHKIIAGLIATILAAGSSASLYISRMATYDIPSFALFFLSLPALHQAMYEKKQSGKWYAMSVGLLLFSILFRFITAIYVPFIVIYSFLVLRKKKEALSFWRKYYFYPLVTALAVYVVTELETILTYAYSQIIQLHSNYQDLLQIFLYPVNVLRIPYTIASLILIFSKKFKKWAILLFSWVWIVLVHFMSLGTSSFDKDMYLSVMFMVITVGLGFSQLLQNVSVKRSKLLVGTGIVAGIVVFMVISYQKAQFYTHLWKDSAVMLDVLPNFVQKEDKVLAESGAPVALALFDTIHPTSVTTFDWLDYDKKSGVEAFQEAARNGYFRVIELESDEMIKPDAQRKISQAVYAEVKDTYQLIYDNNGYQIYQRYY